MKIYGSTPSITIRYALIEANHEWSFSCINSEVSTLTLDSEPFIITTDSVQIVDAITVIIRNTTFKSITHQSGNGSIMEISAEELQSVPLSNLTFESCSCKNGNGAAIYANTSTALTPTFSISYSSFKECSASGYRGGVHWLPSSTPSSLPRFHSILFCENTAQSGGADWNYCLHLESPCATFARVSGVAEVYAVKEYSVLYLNTSVHSAETSRINIGSGYSLTFRPHTSVTSATKSLNNLSSGTVVIGVSGGSVSVPSHLPSHTI